jgi:hypothetical protein
MDTRRAASQATAGRAGRRATLLRYALGLAAIAAVAYFFVRERDLFAGFGATISRLNWVWVVVAFAAELASVPAGVAVAEGYSFARYRRFGADTAVAAWSELAIGAITFCALAVLALVGAVIAGGGAEPILLPVLSVVVAGSAGAVLLAFAGAKVVTSIGITPGGLGVVEGGLVATFVAYGVAGRPRGRRRAGLPGAHPDRPGRHRLGRRGRAGRPGPPACRAIAWAWAPSGAGQVRSAATRWPMSPAPTRDGRAAGRTRVRTGWGRTRTRGRARCSLISGSAPLGTRNMVEASPPSRPTAAGGRAGHLLDGYVSTGGARTG